MDFQGLGNEYMLYGVLFSLCNRIQTIGDGHFEDITMKQHFMLIVLSVMGDKKPTLKETGEVMGCSYQNVKRMALQLEQKGYLHILQDEQDKRKQRLCPTEKIEHLGNQTRAMTQEFMEDLYRGIHKEELGNALQTLMKMNENLMAL